MHQPRDIRSLRHQVGWIPVSTASLYVKYVNALYMEASFCISVKVLDLARDDDGSERANLGERHHASHLRVAFQNSNSLRIDEHQRAFSEIDLMIQPDLFDYECLFWFRKIGRAHV